MLLKTSSESQTESLIPVTKDSTLYKCALSYAMENMAVNGDFRKAHPNVEKYDDAACSSHLYKFREHKYEYFEKLYSDDPYYEEHTKCIVEKLREFAAADLYILKLVYKHGEAKDLSGIRLEKARWEVMAPIEDKMELAETLCLPEVIFSDFFDSLYDDQHEEEKTAEEQETDFCMAYCLVHKKLHGIEKYKIDVNPRKLSVKHIDCTKHLIEYKFMHEAFLEHTFLVAQKSTTKQQEDCYRKTIKSSDYAERIFLAGLLGRNNLNVEQREDEQEKFADYMEYLYDEILDCDKEKS